MIYQDDGHQPETHDGEGARVVLEVGSFFLPHRDALLHLRTRERGSDSCGRGLLALVAVRRHTAAAMTAPVTWQLWAWTAAAGRTSCVLKGRQNALFGRGGRERSIRTDLALSEGTIRCRIIDFFGLPSSDSAHFQYFVPKKLPEIAL